MSLFTRFDTRTAAFAAAFVLILFVAACAGSQSGEQAASSAATSDAAPAQQGQMPSDHPPLDGEGKNLPFVHQGSDTGGGQLAWDAPAAWKSEPPSNSMRKAQYVVPATGTDTQDGECVVFYFGPGQGGEPRANAERWATQFKDASGNPPQPTITESTQNGHSVMRVTVEGTYVPSAMMGGTPPPPLSGAKLLGAIVEGPDANWFFKCTGPAGTMNSNEKAFDAMIASVR